MCGPLAAWASTQGLSHGVYQGARLLGYVLAGALAGAVGGALLTEFRVGQTLLSWTLALGLALSAWRLWRSERGALVPLQRSKPSLRRAATVGFFTMLLPCGALWAGLLIAAGSGTAASGALTMFGFGATSALGLVGAGWVAGRLRAAGPGPRKVLAVALALGACVMVLRPLHVFHESAQCHGAP